MLDIAPTTRYALAMTTLPRRLLSDAVVAASHSEHVTLTATADSITVAAADMWLTVATQLSCNLPHFAATVPARQLVAEIKALPDGDIEIEATQSTLRLRSGKRIATIAQQGRACEIRAIPAEMWQPIENAAELVSALRQVAVASTRDEARPAVSGVRLSRDGIVATDGQRLHRRDVALSWLPRDVTLPVWCVGAICDLLTVEAPKKGKAIAAAPDFAVATGANNIAFRSTTATQQRTVYARLAPEPFVEWRRIIDAAPVAAVAAVSAPRLATWLKSCPGSLVTIGVGQGELKLDYQVLDDTGLRLLGEGSDVIDATVLMSAAPPIKLSVSYLRDVLVGCAGDVRLCWAVGQPLSVRADGWHVVVMFSR